jgi:hypothetical protein
MLAKTLQNVSIPREKDIIFVSPEPLKWSSLLAENKLFTENMPNSLKSRSELLRIARDYTQRIMGIVCTNNIPKNVIATGHQAIWYHCGIWAKNLTACEFAKAVDGSSLHLILDHDICDTAMVLPRQNTDGSWCFEKIEIEPEQKAIPLEFRHLPREAHMRSFINIVINARGGQICNDIWSKCVVLKKGKISSLNNIADVITYFQSVLNVALGLNMVYLPVSKLCQSDAFINFVTSIIIDAGSFATSYNGGIIKQIDELKTSPGRIIQRLAFDKETGWTELPFWLFSPNGQRTSLCVMSKNTDDIRIGTASTDLGNLDSSCLSGKSNQLKNILERLGYRLRPKAVSLTLFARLFLADWFIHGIGGTRYEPVTDYVIEDYYRMEPLRFGVATSTATLPMPNNVTFPKDSISQLKHKLHNIRHNPEKHIDASMLEREPVASLLQAKREKIARAKDRFLPSSLRKSAWSSLSTINEKLFQYAQDTAEILEKEIVEFKRNAISQEVCNHRGYFFGLFPEKKLRKLAKSLTFTE